MAIEHRIFDGRPRSVFEPATPKLREELRKLHVMLQASLLGDPPFRRLYERGIIHGFVPKRGIKTNARRHINSQTVVQVDLHRAFESTSIERVQEGLQGLGLNEVFVEKVMKMSFPFRTLPTGYPTSPVLFNIAILELDVQLAEYASKHNLRYTRYVDDLAFSLEKGNIPQDDIDAVMDIIRAHGYDPHKIRIGHPNSKPVWICGVALFRGRILIPGRQKRSTRARVYQGLLSGTNSGIARAVSLVGYIKHIEGKVPRSLGKYYEIAKRQQRSQRRNRV